MLLKLSFIDMSNQKNTNLERDAERFVFLDVLIEALGNREISFFEWSIVIIANLQRKLQKPAKYSDYLYIYHVFDSMYVLFGRQQFLDREAIYIYFNYNKR